MKKFTIITKDGSKWLRHESATIGGPNLIYTIPNGEDLPYIGTKPEGTTLDESEVREIRQYEYKGEWFNCDYHPFYRAVKRNPNIQTRIAYTDAESHDRHISDDYWKDRAKAAEKLIGISPSDPKTYDEFCRLREEWEQIVKQEPK